jgi:hypothetical protein
MHDCAFRPGAGNRRKGDVLKRPGVTAEAFQRGHRVDLGKLAGRRFLVEPGEKPHHRDAIAFVCRAAADDLA